MKTLVCLKQIPDPEIPPREFRIDQERLEAAQGTANLVTNIFCENALETALQLRDRSVSRVHATLISTRQGVFIRDENSSVGTYINGKRISTRPVQLHHGDKIQLGYGQVFEYRER